MDNKEGLFNDSEMRRIPSYSEIIEYTLGLADDFLPKKHDELSEIELIYLTPSQLRQVIRFINTGVKEDIRNPENYECKIVITKRESKGSYLKSSEIPEELKEWVRKRK